ncbi:UNVERIFIED_CONTAM: hypothetical protein Scaly_0347300 [Sesamum calycinum]|uniref:AIR12 DOMON domain-containing protein n=1 Tax=Sesamum calycinum TaxID=2727403 RepID=A0AAW2SCR2_9LAMI
MDCLGPKPDGLRHAGAQSLIAFKDSNGSVVVKTYNVSVYGPVSESKISYEVLNKRAESSHGVMRIFATLALPSGSAEVNQVWQVGASVKDGVPAKHEFSAENLGAKSKLQLVGHAAEKGGSPAAAPTSVPAAGGPSGNQNGGSSRVWGMRLGLYGAVVVRRKKEDCRFI